MSDKELTRDVVRTEVVPAERTEDAPTFAPNVDILEDAGALTLYADMPGVDPEQIDVCFEDRTLTISGRVAPRWSERASWHYQEYAAGHYTRTFNVTEGVDADRISAEYSDGVLKLHLPKAEGARPKRIKVRSA